MYLRPTYLQHCIASWAVDSWTAALKGLFFLQKGERIQRSGKQFSEKGNLAWGSHLLCPTNTHHSERHKTKIYLLKMIDISGTQRAILLPEAARATKVWVVAVQ